MFLYSCFISNFDVVFKYRSVPSHAHPEKQTLNFESLTRVRLRKAPARSQKSPIVSCAGTKVSLSKN